MSAASPLVEQFLHELAIQRRASPHTLTAYRRDLEQLAAVAKEQALDLPGLNTSHLRRALMKLHAADLAPRSIARTLSGWRSFYAWLARQRHVALNPADGLKAPKRARVLPKTLGVDQTASLLDTPADGPLQRRDAAMFELFYSSGLRLSELVSLNINGGLDITSGEVTVTGKRNKTRTVPLGAKAITALQAWLPDRQLLASGGELALFVGRNGGRLGSRQVAQRLSQWATRSGVGMHVHPHMLRHSFASHLLQSSGDLRAVQEMLGHASIAATQIYTHLDFQHLAKVYDKAHPRAHKKAVG
jgi:integrase/recombinase XerC